MRISTPQIFNSNIDGYQRGYASIVKTQQQISSGVRIQTPADDPVGAARLLQLQQQQGLLTQYSGNMTTISNSLNQEESVLDSITNVLQRARELAVEAGNGALSDEDRAAVAGELDQVQQQLLTLMNSKDASGNYLFSGSKSDVQPFIQNADGTFSYQGDQSTLNLQVSDTLRLAASDNGWSIFEMASNASRTQSSLLTNPDATPGAPQRVFLSQGSVTSDSTYNQNFRSGAPYTVNIVSATSYQILDKDGNDVTSEANTNGVYDAANTDGNSISFRGTKLMLDVAPAKGDDGKSLDDLTAGYSFSFGMAPDGISSMRSATNTSNAQITAASVSDSAAYTSQFPSGGVQLRFTSATDYEVYAMPAVPGATPMTSGTLGATFPQNITVAGIDLTLSEAPATGDQFSISGSSPERQNILNTIGQLRDTLNTPTVNDPAAKLALRNQVAAALSNIDNGMRQVGMAQSSVGARLNTIDVLKQENQSIGLANASTQSSIRDTDIAEAASQLMLQQTMLEAAQASFARISQLSLFDKL
ncbi:flagellar hook-associated protein 3 [Pseudomonas citronellolis]|uniref:flagellar hook-associated protein 3 n=1 Tax=Pseudomonas citronellolis TaxID=53408 RepID=UPI000852ECD5|nr:flagellar hook-associated protein 3 [Pseudomonas humi]